MSISPILFSGLKERPLMKHNASLLEDASVIVQRNRGIKTPFRLAKELLAWAKWLPFDHPFGSLISGGRAVIKLSQPPTRQLKLFSKGLGLWKTGTGLGTATLMIGKQVISKGLDWKLLNKVYRVVKECFLWMLRTVNFACKAVLLVSHRVLGSIASQLPELVFKTGMATTAPLIGVSLMSQLNQRLERNRIPEPENPILLDAHRSATKVMSLGLLSTLCKTISFCLTGFGLLSTLAVPVLISLSFSTAGISSSVAALYEKNKAALAQNYVSATV